ncbi:T9SS type A sorting domain-containing protein [Flavobacterium sp. RHBU_24]|uniref:T9SS type A sorting domain-containing protein n=1 Tax=Flavobacterium sp. RHBU_24 TaxID=3391185 RepID=UPI0039849987
MKKIISTVAVLCSMQFTAIAQCNPVNLPYAEDLSNVVGTTMPQCYTTQAETFSSNVWQISSGAAGFDDNYFIFYTQNDNVPNVAASLYVRQLNLVAGKTYNVSYKCQNSLNQFELFSLYPDIRKAGGNSVYNHATIVYDGTLTNVSREFEVTETGVYYFLFTLYTTSNTGDFYLDDIVVEEVDDTMAANDVTAYSFQVYPNPVEQIAIITGNVSIDKIELVSTTGQLLQSRQPNAAETRIDLSALAAGVYYLNINSGNEIIRKKIIKQ